jgi:hypothetical protein
MRTFCSMLALSAVLALQPALAQTPEEMQAQMDASVAAAREAAVRPGDEALTCDQLQAEIVANTQNPEYQAQVAAMGQTAQGQMDQMQAARERAQGQMAGSIAMGVISSFIPGAGYAQMLAQRAQAAQMEQQTQANQAQMMSMMDNVNASMPYVMRGQRLYELAQAQQCAFLQAPPTEQIPPQE